MTIKGLQWFPLTRKGRGATSLSAEQPHRAVMLQKRKITNLSAVALVTRAANPAEIFLETKDNTHPLKLVRDSLCIIGGNWIGEEAKADSGPLDTARREWSEELSLDKKRVSRGELKSLGLDKDASSAEMTGGERGTSEDVLRLDDIRQAIIEGMRPFGAFACTITREAILSADPEAKQKPFTSLSNVFLSSLDERLWGALTDLQAKYNNLLVEFSTSTVTSLDEIVERKTRGAFGYDQVLQRYFSAMGLAKAAAMPLVPYVLVEEMSPMFGLYKDYLDHYDIEKRP